MWKDIEGFENYKINENGEIVNKRTNHTLKHSINEKGYHKVILQKDNKKHKTGVHRLVAKAFIPNPNNYREVNHIDENKDNNNYKNLEWCNREQNIAHSIKSGKFIITQVAQYDKNNQLIKIFNSCSEAERETGIPRTHICRCALGRYGYKTAGGYIWKSVKDIV
jgi:hypothetical protein